MIIPPLPPTTIASLAGTDRAASTNAAQSSAAERSNAAANTKPGTSVDGVDKGNASDDRDADGRQLLDTFERQTQDHEDQSDEAKSKTDESDSHKATEGNHAHIDFTA